MRKISKYFVESSSGILEKVLMCPPTYAKLTKSKNGKNINVDRDKCLREHDDLVHAYRSNGIEVELLSPDKGLCDQVFSRDFGACVREGYILGNFKNASRKGEREAYSKKMKELQVPCIAECCRGFFEGGDFWMLDDRTIAIGILERSDEVGVLEISRGLEKYGYHVIGVPSSEKCIHLDMCFNIVAEGIAVASREVLPEKFLELLKSMNFKIIDVDKKDIMKCFCNLQSIGGGRVISFIENREVNKKMKSEGLEVIELDICETFKHEGGVHCMTFPIRRKK